jgi:hypothetical protein
LGFHTRHLSRFYKTGAPAPAFLFAILVCAHTALAKDYRLVSEAKNYSLTFQSLSEGTTGTIALIDEATSETLSTIQVPPGKLRAEPRAVWRDDSADVAIELDTHNPCSPAYIFFYARNKGYVGLSYGSLGAMAGYLGINKSEIIRSRYMPKEWMHTPLDGAQIINVRQQCWNKKNKRYTNSDPVLIDADGAAGGR